MNQPPPPPGGYPPPPPPGGNPPQPGGYPPAPGGYPPQPGGYPTQPGGYPAQPGGYPTQPGGYPTQSGGYPPAPPEDHTARNVVIGVLVVALVFIGLVGAYALSRPPAPSFPPIIPTASPEPTKTPKASPTEKPTKEATAQPTAEATVEATAEATQEPPTQEPTAETPTDEPTAEATQEPGATPEGTTIPGVEDQEIVLGEPIIIGDPSFQQVTLLVQNVSDLVKSYSLKGTFKDGDTITATASGYVSNHLPGSIRTPTLYVDGEPGASDVLTVAIDSMLIEEESTPESDVARQISFGKPTINTGDFATVDVEVTNGSDATISGLTVSAGIMRDGQLVGVASGVLSDMAPGQVKTATLYVTGDIAETDELLLTVETVLLEQ